MSRFFPFVLVVGPTAVGKSNLALALAEKLNGCILNCDSLQTYQRLNIGTAKPTATEQKRVQHFLIDILAPGEVLTAGDFRRQALDVLERELPKRPVIGVGGSGFYIQALLKGMFAVNKPDPAIEAKIRERLENEGLPALYAELEDLDPEYAKTINANDAYRVSRALVVIHDSGEKVSSLRKKFALEAGNFPYPYVQIGLSLNREDLIGRVTKRAEEMLNAGLLDEARRLVQEGWSDWPPLHSVGYKECLRYLHGEMTHEQLLPQIVEKTMQLAKKQRTWFKKDTTIHWLSPQQDFNELVQQALGIVDRTIPKA